MRGLKDYLLIGVKGMAMGAADVVPGVSGGTIAFITGIYEELIDTISRVNFQTLQILFKGKVAPFWKEINGNFIVSLLLGIAISIVTLAKLIAFLLEDHAIATWSFFFGLVLASIPIVARKVKSWKGSRYFAFGAGAIIAWLITDLPPVPETDANWYIFISGMIAICAMILPGISGSFILILMGSYMAVLSAVNDRETGLILIFMAGAVIGLLSFSRLLKFMFSKFHDITIAVLSGFLLGSLNKIWPWKNVLEWFVRHQGEANERKIATITENVSPTHYMELTGNSAQLGLAIGMAVLGFIVIFGIDRLAAKKS